MTNKLIKALAAQSVTVRNITSGEISLHYPELDGQNYPTGLLLRKHNKEPREQLSN